MDDQEKLFGSDEIYEAIKREDFLAKLKNIIPLLILGAVVILASTIGYVWWQYRHEQALYEAEEAYKGLLDNIQEGQFSEAKKKAQSDLLKKDKGFATLASLQLAHLFQEDARMTHSALSTRQMKEVYEKVLKERHTLSMVCFFAAAEGFLDPSTLEGKNAVEIQKFFMPGHSFYDVGLILQTLSAYASGSRERIKNSLYLWEKEASPNIRWLPAYCAIGQGLPRPMPQMNKENRP